MTDKDIRDVIPENLQSDEVAYYDDVQDDRGLNRFMMLLITAAMIPWLFGGVEIFGFKIMGWAWVIPLIVASLICLKNLRYIAFPIGLWIFWALLLGVYWFFGRGNPDALQSLMQMLSPIVVGCAVSTFRAENRQLEKFITWITRLAIITWILLLIRWPIVLTGKLPGHGFMAAEMIGLLLLGACYASFYACGSRRHLYYYFSMVAIVFVALVRGPLVAMLSCLPFTPVPLGVKKRIILVAVIIICTAVIFNTERVQQRMFFSGSGKIADIRWENPDFITTGRSVFLDVLWPGVEQEPIWGNGFNSYRNVFTETGFERALPHNDWLKLLHDIGIVGTGIYLVTMLLQIFFLVRIARWSGGARQMLAYGAATAFIPYMLIMLTDNVILYVQFFGNLHFALIGLVYGANTKSEG